MTMAISVFHYPFYNKLGGLIQMLFRLLAQAPALRLRLPRDLLGPQRRPFLRLPQQVLALFRRIGPHLL